MSIYTCTQRCTTLIRETVLLNILVFLLLGSHIGVIYRKRFFGFNLSIFLFTQLLRHVFKSFFFYLFCAYVDLTSTTSLTT